MKDRFTCLFLKTFKKREISLSRASEVKLYDAILFNFEGEKRVDIVTTIERHDTIDTNILVYGTCVHGLINSTSVERNLGSIKWIMNPQWYI